MSAFYFQEILESNFKQVTTTDTLNTLSEMNFKLVYRKCENKNQRH